MANSPSNSTKRKSNYTGVGVKLGNTLAKIARKQVETSVRFKQARMEEVKMNEDLYFGKSLPRLKGRFSVPLPTMSGYVDTLQSKIDEPPTLNFTSDDIADFKETKKVSAIAKKEIKKRALRWNAKDRNQKKLATFSGVGIGEFFAESDPKYKNTLNIVDHYDFQCEPMGGGYLEDHSFCGKMNLFKSNHDLDQGVKSGRYHIDQVAKLKASLNTGEAKRNVEIFKNKINRFQLLGLDPDTYDYVGQQVFPLIWWGLEYKGQRYLLLFDYTTSIWVSARKLTDDFESGLWPWTSWQTHPDEFVYWSKSPADDVRPVAIAIDIIFNQALDNRQKRNFGQRAYDPSVFPNPEELEWRPDGLVRAETLQGLKQIGNGIYEFQTPEVTGTIDMIGFMDAYTGRKTGITDAAQGESDEKKVGIFFGELQQVADRLGLYNKSYSEYHAEIGLRMLWGMKEHLDQETSVKLIGTKGIETETLLADKINPEWDIDVSGGQAEFRANEIKKQKRAETLDRILNHASLSQKLNPEWGIRQLLLAGEWDDDEIVKALDLSDTADAELIAEAEQAIQEIMAGETPQPNRDANTAFIKHIVDFAVKKTFDKDPKKDIIMFRKIIEYADEHKEIAARNAVRKAEDIMTQAAIQNAQGGGRDGSLAPDDKKNKPVAIEKDADSIADAPPPNTKAGTQKISGDITKTLTP